MGSNRPVPGEGSPAPAFHLPAVQGGDYSLEELLRDRRALALLFLRGTW